MAQDFSQEITLYDGSFNRAPRVPLLVIYGFSIIFPD